MIGWPLDTNRIRRGKVSNTFGKAVRHDIDGKPKPHQGWDFHAPIGTLCYAISDSRVALIYESRDYGKVLVLQFDRPFTSYGRIFAAYCHLSSIAVDPGQKVKLGDIVARTGDSGNARGMKGEDSHLHFEIRTEARPGIGLAGRLSPLVVFGKCPLIVAAERDRG